MRARKEVHPMICSLINCPLFFCAVKLNLTNLIYIRCLVDLLLKIYKYLTASRMASIRVYYCNCSISDEPTIT